MLKNPNFIENLLNRTIGINSNFAPLCYETLIFLRIKEAWGDIIEIPSNGGLYYDWEKKDYTFQPGNPSNFSGYGDLEKEIPYQCRLTLIDYSNFDPEDGLNAIAPKIFCGNLFLDQDGNVLSMNIECNQSKAVTDLLLSSGGIVNSQEQKINSKEGKKINYTLFFPGHPKYAEIGGKDLSRKQASNAIEDSKKAATNSHPIDAELPAQQSKEGNKINSNLWVWPPRKDISSNEKKDTTLNYSKIKSKANLINHSSVKIHLILAGMQNNASSIGQPTEQAINNVKKIKEICNAKYANQSFYGADALNRLIVLDPDITKLLTPETILAIFFIYAQTQEGLHKENPICIQRNSTGQTTLLAVMWFAFKQNGATICWMPNNESNYGIEQYTLQKEHYEKNTSQIITNIKIAAGLIGINVDDAKYQEKTDENQTSFTQTFDGIVKIVNKIKNDGESRQLLAVPGYTADAIRSQSISGFLALCEQLGINYKEMSDSLIILEDKVTLEQLVKQFVASEKAILHKKISHFFYDPKHFIACFEQESLIVVAGKLYYLTDVLREMMICCDLSDDTTISIVALEQFYTRLKLVDDHLQQNFPLYCKKITDEYVISAKSSSEIKYPVPEGYQKLQALILALETQANIASLICQNSKLKKASIQFLQRLLALYDKHEGKLSLVECSDLASKEYPEGHKNILEEAKTKFIVSLLSDNPPQHRIQGPRPKRYVTTVLETIIQKLLSGHQPQCVFNVLNELEMTLDGKVFNLTHILRNQPDFEQIMLDEEHLTSYVAFIKTHAKYKPIKEILGEAKIPSPQDYAMLCRGWIYLPCHYAKKLTQTLYTDDQFCRLVQAFLRNYGQSELIQEFSGSELTQLVIELLLCTAVASCGLVEPMELTNEAATEIEACTGIRKEKGSSQDKFFQERMAAVKSQKPIVSCGFASTSIEKVTSLSSNIFCFYRASRMGQFIGNASLFPNEKELNFPPNIEVQPTSYIKDSNENHFFSMWPARSISVSYSDSYLPPQIIRHELEIIRAMLDQYIQQCINPFSNGFFEEDKVMVLVVKSLRESMEPLFAGTPEALDINLLKRFQNELADKIANNHSLGASLNSLKKSEELLKSALQRLNRIISTMENYLNSVIREKSLTPEAQKRYDEKFGVSLWLKS